MEITKNVHLLETTKGSYVYLVLGQEPVLIDTGMPGRSQQILKELTAIGIDPKEIAHILLTHHDVDHIGNAKQLQAATGATLWAPEADLPYIHGEKSRAGLRKLTQLLMRVDTPHIEHTYQAGQTIGDLEVIPTPGHTEGHVSVRAGDSLFAGDLVTSSKGKLKPSPGILTTDKEALRLSLKRVGELKFDWVCPAHGLPVARGNLWETLLSR